MFQTGNGVDRWALSSVEVDSRGIADAEKVSVCLNVFAMYAEVMAEFLTSCT